jgi:formamidopyrimidine-DNA glycosylase
MPELPEVETTRRKVEQALKGKRLIEVIVDPSDRIVFDRDSASEIVAALQGAKVVGSGRKGKYLWLKLDRRPWPVFHLGMTGHLQIRRAGGGFVLPWGGEKHRRGSAGHLKSKSKSPVESKVLPYCRMRLRTRDGTEIAFTDPRRFGRVRLAQDPEGEVPISRLGYDPLHTFPSARKLGEILPRRRAPIKAVLLDQALFAGVGNWIADEVLFQARISPLRLASTLDAREVSRLRSKLISIIRLAVKVGASYDRYPRSWLFHYRWGKTAGTMTTKKHPIAHATIGGRTTAWVPELQK